jgi:oligopeptide/dipeptide ABC transporter ATP-binding protein
MMKPDLLICDEVVSALDVSIQGQILNLLLDLRSRRASSGQDISFLFIAHDLKVASYFCDRIGVMYRGEIMEEAPATELWNHYQHPYTELLFNSVKLEGGSHATARSERTAAETPLHANAGCAFVARCPYAEERCFNEKPELRAVDEKHLIRCWRESV